MELHCYFFSWLVFWDLNQLHAGSKTTKAAAEREGEELTLYQVAGHLATAAGQTPFFHFAKTHDPASSPWKKDIFFFCRETRISFSDGKVKKTTI